MSDAAIQRQLWAFVASFDGSADAGYVQVFKGEREPWLPSFLRPTPVQHTQPLGPNEDYDERELLRLRLDDLLCRGFTDTSDKRPKQPRDLPLGAWVLELPSLRIGVRGGNRRPVRVSNVKLKARRDYEAPGAYVLLVDGSLPDLVYFLVAQLLTSGPGMVAVARCAAPADRRWSERCNRFFVKKGLGRPRKYCSEKCYDRATNKRKYEGPPDEPKVPQLRRKR